MKLRLRLVSSPPRFPDVHGAPHQLQRHTAHVPYPGDKGGHRHRLHQAALYKGVGVCLGERKKEDQEIAEYPQYLTVGLWI